MATECPEAIQVKVCRADGSHFYAQTYWTPGKQKLSSRGPYVVQKGMYGLFTDRVVAIGDVINGRWRVVGLDRPVPDRIFCDVVGFELYNETCVRLSELTKREGFDARITPEDRGEVSAGIQVVKEDSGTRDDRKLPRDSVLFCLLEGHEKLIADRWQIHHDGQVHTVRSIRDVDHPERLPVVVTSRDHVRA